MRVTPSRRLSFARDANGVTAIEFAIIAPVLMLLIFGVIEYALVMVVFNVMESATANSSRLGKTGFVSAGLTRQQTIINAISTRAGNLIDPTRMTVTSKFYKQYDQINDPEPYQDTNHNGSYTAGETFTDINGNAQWDADMGASGFGSAGDIVVYTITYPWSIKTPIMREMIGTNGNINIITHAVVKNEPY